MSFDANPYGLVKKSEEELLSDLEQKAIELFGTNVDLSFYSISGISVSVQLSFDSVTEIRFSHPTYLNIYVNVAIELDVRW